MLYTGLDFHKSFSYITTVNDQGDILGQKKLPSNAEIVDSAAIKAFCQLPRALSPCELGWLGLVWW